MGSRKPKQGLSIDTGKVENFLTAADQKGARELSNDRIRRDWREGGRRGEEAKVRSGGVNEETGQSIKNARRAPRARRERAEIRADDATRRAGILLGEVKGWGGGTVTLHRRWRSIRAAALAENQKTDRRTKLEELVSQSMQWQRRPVESRKGSG